MSEAYEIMFKIDILTELAAGIAADYWRFIKKYKMAESEKERLDKLGGEALKYTQTLLKCNTMEDVVAVEKRLETMKEDIDRLEESKSDEPPRRRYRDLFR